MDELLASIRRIIAEEDLSAAMTPRPGPANPAQAWTRPAPAAPHDTGYGDDDQALPPPAAAGYAPSRPAPQVTFPPPIQAAESYESRPEEPQPTAAAYAPPRPTPFQAAEGYESRREAPQPLPAASARTALRPGPERDDPRRADIRRSDAARDAAAPPPDGRGRNTAEHHPEPVVPEVIARHPSEPGYPSDDARPEPAGAEPPRVLRRDGESAGRVERLERPAGRMPGAAARPAAAAPAPRKDLLGPNADAALSAAFHALGDLALPQQPRTVEDLMKEILRPMLKEWLDRNLPAVVEDLVRAEIERVSARNRRG